MNTLFPWGWFLSFGLSMVAVGDGFRWQRGTAESQGRSSERLVALERSLVEENTKGFLVIRNDVIVHEWYASGHSRSKKHYTASMAKEPWGPWETVYYSERWDVGPGETSHFPPKWMSQDGRTMHLVFSGDDAFSVRRLDLEVKGE